MRFSKRQRTLGRARHPWSTLAWTAYGIRWLPAVYTRCRHKMATGLLGGPRTSSICEGSSQSTVWLLGPSTTAATVRLRRIIPRSHHPVDLSFLSQHHSTALPSPKRYDKRYEEKVLINIDPHQLPTSTWGDTENGEVGDTRFLISFSIDGELCLNTSSEATQSLSNGLGGVSQR